MMVIIQDENKDMSKPTVPPKTKTKGLQWASTALLFITSAIIIAFLFDSFLRNYN